MNLILLVTLKDVIRQGEHEEELRDVLSCLREYRAIPSQTQWLQQFQWNNLKLTHGVDLLERLLISGLFVFPTHDKEWVNNRSKLLDINKTFPVAKIASVSKGPHSKTGQSENAGGLLDTVIKSKKSKVMISVNLCVVWSLYWCNWHC